MLDLAAADVLNASVYLDKAIKLRHQEAADNSPRASARLSHAKMELMFLNEETFPPACHKLDLIYARDVFDDNFRAKDIPRE